MEMWTLCERFFPDVADRMKKKLVYVVGDVKDEINVDKDEKEYYFVGNCAKWEGTIDGKKVKIGGKYKKIADMNPRKVKQMTC